MEKVESQSMPWEAMGWCGWCPFVNSECISDSRVAWILLEIKCVDQLPIDR